VSKVHMVKKLKTVTHHVWPTCAISADFVGKHRIQTSPSPERSSTELMGYCLMTRKP